MSSEREMDRLCEASFAWQTGFETKVGARNPYHVKRRHEREAWEKGQAARAEKERAAAITT